MSANPSTASPRHEIIVARTQQEQQQCIDLRIDVFHKEQGFPLETEIDELDSDDRATHFLLRLTPSLKPIGTIRCHKVPEKEYYKLTRLVVLKDYRQFRFGRALVEALHDWVKQDVPEHPRDPPRSTVEIITHSQLPVKSFYAKFGYEPEGDEFDEDGDPHQKMVLHIPLGQVA